jgi:DNA-binding helix-hairpin-helix protein with protein kinase domain
MYRALDPEKKGDFRGRVKAAIQIANAIRYLNLKGFAQGDISGRNFLINPVDGRAVLIDLDGLTVPGYMEGGVVGTPGYMAPELIIGWTEGKRVVPDRLSDRHALAVLLYQFLLMTHPLLSGTMPALSESAEEDSMLRMGKHALYVEHPTDKRNQLPAGYPLRTDLLGDRLKELFRKAFVDGLDKPQERPQHAEWMSALTELLEDIATCQNPACELRAFPSRGYQVTHCPFCGTAAKYDTIGSLLVYSAERGDSGFFRRSTADIYRIAAHGRISLGMLFTGKDDGVEALHLSKQGLVWKVRVSAQPRPLRCTVFDMKYGGDPQEIGAGSEI